MHLKLAEYQQYFDECLRWADKARTAQERKAFLDLAQTWSETIRVIRNQLVKAGDVAGEVTGVDSYIVSQEKARIQREVLKVCEETAKIIRASTGSPL